MPVKILDSDPVDIEIQDQTSNRLSLYLGNILSQITLLTAVDKDVESIDIETTGAVPAIGDFVCLQGSGNVSQLEILTVTPIAGNQYTVTLSMPLDHDYAITDGCTLMNVNMNINGSVTPKSFEIRPRGDIRWDINRLLISMILTTAGDDGTFGNIPQITKGVYFRKEDSAKSQNLFNARNNSDFRIEGYDVAYTSRSGGLGDYGLSARVTFNGQDKAGVAIRIDGESNDSFKAIVRDDLSLLGRFRVKIQGHVVEDNI